MCVAVSLSLRTCFLRITPSSNFLPLETWIFWWIPFQKKHQPTSNNHRTVWTVSFSNQDSTFTQLMMTIWGKTNSIAIVRLEWIPFPWGPHRFAHWPIGHIFSVYLPKAMMGYRRYFLTLLTLKKQGKIHHFWMKISGRNAQALQITSKSLVISWWFRAHIEAWFLAPCPGSRRFTVGSVRIEGNLSMAKFWENLAWCLFRDIYTSLSDSTWFLVLPQHDTMTPWCHSSQIPAVKVLPSRELKINVLPPRMDDFIICSCSLHE